jgi:phosphate/sulfate permease
VSCGTLIGIGAVNGRARWRTIAGIGAAWVTTLPLAALLGALGRGVLGTVVSR